jgi:hypothetical protein
MSWDRRGKRQYYSRSYRVNGRIIREYVGGGVAGERAAAEDAQRRARRRAEVAARRAEQELWHEAEEALRGFDELMDLLARATLLSANYHQHARGEWRRRHVHDLNSQPGEGP